MPKENREAGAAEICHHPHRVDGHLFANLDASTVRLTDLLKPRKTVIDYLYDFGDSWEHRIIVSKIRSAGAGVSYPRYVGGECNLPPDDCGGLPGFYNSLEALADKKHPDHAYAKDWFGTYEPGKIDVPRIEKAVSKTAGKAKAARKGHRQSSLFREVGKRVTVLYRSLSCLKPACRLSGILFVPGKIADMRFPR